MLYTCLKVFSSDAPFGFSEPRKISMAGCSARRSPATVRTGSVKVSCTPLPCWCAVRSLIAAGTGGEGAVGSPGAPQPASSSAPKIATEIVRRCGRETLAERPFTEIVAPVFFEFRNSSFEFRILQDVAAQILVLYDIGQLFVDVRGIDLDGLFLEVRRFERQFIENFFHDGVQPARADIFGLFVYRGGEFGD